MVAVRWFLQALQRFSPGGTELVRPGPSRPLFDQALKWRQSMSLGGRMDGFKDVFGGDSAVSVGSHEAQTSNRLFKLPDFLQPRGWFEKLEGRRGEMTIIEDNPASAQGPKQGIQASRVR